MCGITGVLYLNPKKDASCIKRMTDALRHRGPDAEGFYEEEGKIALGHRRLAIIDLSEGGKQPMADVSERYRIVFNGEIYNYLALKAQLSDYPFQSKSDTEVILAAYNKWGKSCTEYLKGQYAFAIWDKKEQTLFLARDRMGEKPLYYYKDEEVFVFASEINSLLKSEYVPKKLSLTGVVDYLKYQSVNAPNTILESVYQIPAASWAWVENGQLTISTYWNIAKSNQTHSYDDYHIVTNNVQYLLRKAVKSQMMSDVPLGAFLSGGIDSSAIVGLMAESSSNPIHTFSVIFDEPQYDESYYSNIIAKKFNTEHHAIRLKPSVLIERLQEALKYMDTPSGDGLNTYIISEVTKKAGITVALSGLGGDDLFAGYPAFLNYYRLQKYKTLWQTPLSIRQAFAAGLNLISPTLTGQKFADLVQLSDISLKNVYPLSRQIFTINEIHHIAPNLAAHTDYLKNNIQLWEKDVATLPILSQYSIAELKGYTANVLLKDSDCMGMAHSLEIRNPFFDADLITYVLNVPDKMKYPKTPKKLLVDSLSPLLPPEIVNRPKMGFSFPWDTWLRHELKNFINDSIQSLAERAIFDKSRLLKYYQDFQSHNPKVSWSRIWLLVILENWLKKHDF